MKADKTTQIVAYIISKTCNITKTALMKLCYFVDLVSIKKTGEQLTDFQYIGYRYGPFDSKIYNRIDALERENVVISEVDYIGGEDHIVYNYNFEQEKLEYNLIENNEYDLIDEVLQQLNGYGAKALSEIAYKTKPMIEIGAVVGGIEHLYKPLDLSK